MPAKPTSSRTSSSVLAIRDLSRSSLAPYPRPSSQAQVAAKAGELLQHAALQGQPPAAGALHLLLFQLELALSRPWAKNFSPSLIRKRFFTLNRSRSASLSSTRSDVYGVRMLNSSDSAMISSWIAGEPPCSSRCRGACAPKARDERVAVLGVGQGHLAR